MIGSGTRELLQSLSAVLGRMCGVGQHIGDESFLLQSLSAAVEVV